MQFSPTNPIVKLCLQGMALEDKGELEDALKLFLQAWHESTDDLERFIAAHYVARCQDNAGDRLAWLEKALEFARRIDDAAVRPAFRPLYSNIARSLEELGNADRAKAYYKLADSSVDEPCDDGPFYHGTRADLDMGDLLTPGGSSNYQPGLLMNHIYFTALAHGAGLAAALAKGDGRERVYIVEPTGPFENDPNVTNKKFAGNLTRSYRSTAPLRIIGELTNWAQQSPQELREWRERLARSTGEIIN